MRRGRCWCLTMGHNTHMRRLRQKLTPTTSIESIRLNIAKYLRMHTPYSLSEDITKLFFSISLFFMNLSPDFAFTLKMGFFLRYKWHFWHDFCSTCYEILWTYHLVRCYHLLFIYLIHLFVYVSFFCCSEISFNVSPFPLLFFVNTTACNNVIRT